MDWTSSIHDVIFTTILSSDDDSVTETPPSSTAYHSRSSHKIYQEEEEKSTSSKASRAKQLKKLISKDVKCSICLHIYVKPITLVCGHT